ncbi:single-stranded DNA-binding protein [Maledivibacter halophilus]|uniref:Single-stranded DNA-binding protein n=1 Tax=Maledivibacter halophilus TaxID=36842 RepID=A0A1T5MJA1_9FIRM|nr:single-stranded DNA-binding protein [Maledivibacter halophilus]SKC88311.1 single-strand binding protein [Maledivibacter halophilus]
MNSVVMIGRLTRDPELRFTAGSGKAVATFSIAVDRPFSKNRETDFFRVVVWGKAGENCANYLAKGRLVGVQGRLQNNRWEDQDGRKRNRDEIVADRVEFLEWGNKKDNNDNFNPELPDFNDGADDFQAIEDDDDVPF